MIIKINRIIICFYFGLFDVIIEGVMVLLVEDF